MDIYKAMRERVAAVYNSPLDPDVHFKNLTQLGYYLADQILSIRLNDKLDPDPEGRYGIFIGDREAKLVVSNKAQKAMATFSYTAEDTRLFLAGFVQAQYQIKDEGFVKEIKEND